MDEGGAGRASTPRLVAIAAAVVLGMFASYQLGAADGPIGMLVIPLALAVVVIGTLALVWPIAPRRATRTSSGWDRFDLELERSRRHERPLALLRIAVSRASADRQHAAQDAALREAVRVLDTVWTEGANLFVLMPETDRVALARTVSRILLHLPGTGLDAMRVAVFPEDGLTSGALIARLEAEDAEPRPTDIVHLAPASVDVQQQSRTG